MITTSQILNSLNRVWILCQSPARYPTRTQDVPGRVWTECSQKKVKYCHSATFKWEYLSNFTIAFAKCQNYVWENLFLIFLKNFLLQSLHTFPRLPLIGLSPHYIVEKCNTTIRQIQESTFGALKSSWSKEQLVSLTLLGPLTIVQGVCRLYFVYVSW